jgi:hypothetical protein
MHTVAQTKPFVAAAREAGLTEEEIDDVVSYLAENPLAGDEIAGTGGCRKVRIAGRGKGKSGGYRTITSIQVRQCRSSCLPCFLKERNRH